MFGVTGSVVNGRMTEWLGAAWKDRRLRWDQEEWKTDTLRIKSFGRLWVPDIHSEKHDTAGQSSDYVTYQNIESNNKGNVTARLEFRIQAQCEMDYSDYPNDLKDCCFVMQSSLYRRYIKYFLETEDDQVDISEIKTNWQVEKANIKKITEEGDNKSEQLQVCLRARRRSTTLTLELTIPVLVSALIILIAPFFGRFHQQIYVKMFALLLQFMSFQFLAEKTPQVGFGATIPKIYLFYAFTLAVTVISLIVTVIVSAMSRVKRTMPPAHRYTLFASVLNANLCCGSEVEPVTDGTSNKDANADWLQIYTAVNNLASGLTLLVYVFGAIVIVT
ncbi:hypothetical protein WR25_25247 [Diploscapter pachys]|uniref:Neurotransmitter-gated ion-channel ligand-binding domain-containing protein n=1 Tax=Diploscapter pachys TaxID=2018661 RepID=A0A2A2LEI3_9BILA|nr:hypothetical protein WR25_25247 [Diploscapter pachys]